MQTVTVNASKTYDVLIKAGCRALLPQKLKDLFGGAKVCVVTDETVAAIHLEEIETMLQASSISCCSYVFPGGEESKSTETLFNLLEVLAARGFSRRDVLIALGGGITGDLCGLTAALFMRGMAFIQIPTTLLAMVDASVGGKTAVNLRAGKNLAGAFHQPSLVLCDSDYLATLPKTIFADGMAEVIKYGMIADRALFDQVQNGVCKKDLEAIITRCVSIKRDLVAADEFDTGARQLLNFGHTLGHAIEKMSDFEISHGSAVAIGMARVCRLADQSGFSRENTLDPLLSALKNNNLPFDAPFSNESLLKLVRRDKKSAGNAISLILPRKIGQCEIVPMSFEEAEALLRS